MPPPIHKYSGARAMILLHEKYLRLFYQTWTIAKAKSIVLPQTTDRSYKSLDTLLLHVLRCAGNYMIWMCEKLELPHPGIVPPPSLENIVNEANTFMEHVLAKWETPLADVDEKCFYEPEYLSRWNVQYCIDAMMEHAVMHPLRHENQLTILIKEHAGD